MQQLAPGAPLPLDDEQGGEEDEDAEEAEALLEQLGGSGEKPAQLADYFEGHELPCPHVAKQWPRSEMYRDRTSHYDPRMVGDHARGALLTKLERIAEAQLAAKESAWATTYAYESKSLVSGISFLADLRLHLESLGVTLAEAVRAGGLTSAATAGVPQAVVDAAVQARSIHMHFMERLAVLNKVALGNSTELEILSKPPQDLVAMMPVSESGSALA